MSWFKKKLPLFGQVFFRSTLAPRAEDFSYLSELGFSVRPISPATEERWALDVRHPRWGNTRLSCWKEMLAVQRPLLQFDGRLTDEEKETLLSCRAAVQLKTEPATGHVLRDRKNFLQIGNAICGTDGVALQDAVGHAFWTATAMQDELSHDADLDVTGIFTFHAITDDNAQPKDGEPQRAMWVHSHGLREIGKFDFDLIAPSPDAISARTDFMRATAFAVVEDRVALDGEPVPIVLNDTPIRFVSARKFLETAAGPEVDAYRASVDEDHTQQHGIACDPEARGLFARLFGRSTRITPSRVVSAPFPDGGLLAYSPASSELMADRARKSISLFAQWREEFAEFEPTSIAKLGFKTPGDGKEYPWFEVHGLTSDNIDATCINEPYCIPNLKLGQRGQYPLELLYDWIIMLPFGNLTPQSTSTARRIRAKLPELRQVMSQVKAQMVNPQA